MQGGTQHYVNLPAKPLIENSQFIVWKLSKAELKAIIDKPKGIQWKRIRDGGAAKKGEFHPTAITRLAPPRPLSRVLAILPRRFTKRHRVLYHGMGRDTHGLEALKRNRYTVVGYDPYHPDKQVRKYPRGRFREVWSIYTLNVVTKEEGIRILEEIHDLLDTLIYKSKADTVFAIIAVRRDNS